MVKKIFQLSILFFTPLSVQAYDISLEGLAMQEKISWGILFFTISVCFLVLIKIFFVNMLLERQKRTSRRFAAMEKLYNMGTVLVFSYAEAWYRYAKRTEAQAFESHGDMRDMRATATGQIISYLLGRDYINQDRIRDVEVRSRATVTRSYVPLWADEIMNREPLFRELVIQSLMYGNYLAKYEERNQRKSANRVDIGTEDRRQQIIKKYCGEQDVVMNKKRYKELINVFSGWDDQFLTLTDAEKISRADKNGLFLKKDE